jgi:hypothetical protein
MPYPRGQAGARNYLELFIINAPPWRQLPVGGTPISCAFHVDQFLALNASDQTTEKAVFAWAENNG